MQFKQWIPIGLAFCLTLPLAAQVEELNRALSHPLFKQLRRSQESGLNSVQKKLLSEAIDRLSEEELKAALRELGLDESGSAEVLRERLKLALKVKEPENLPDAPAPPRVVIENASEGEFMRGSEDERGLLILRGRIRVRIGDAVFTADTVIVDTSRKEVYAEGNVVYTSPESQIKAERFLFDQRLGTGIIYGAEGYQHPVYFRGKSLSRLGEGKFALRNAFFTSCAAEKPHYNFTARRLWLYENDKIVATGVLLYVGGIPVLPVPFVYASDWGTGIVSQMGVGRVQGFFWQNMYQFSQPSAFASSWAPVHYRFTYDYYEKTGQVGGLTLSRFSPNLNYYMDLGIAEYRRYEIIADFREKDQIDITNQIKQSDGSYDRELRRWQKGFVLLNYKGGDASRNQVRNVQLRYENYTHRLYEFEYGYRYMPASTIPALYQNNEAGRGLIRNDLDWNFTYNESFDDLRLRVAASRKKIWRESSTATNSKYIPTEDVAPQLSLDKNTLLGTIPGTTAAVYWDNHIGTQSRRIYTQKPERPSVSIQYAEFQTMITSEAKSSFRTFFAPGPYLSFEPRAGYGVQRSTVSGNPEFMSVENQTNLRDQARRSSYEYFFTEDALTLGPDRLFLRATYRFKESQKEEQKDVPTANPTRFENRQKINETELNLETRPMTGMRLALTGIYDHRTYLYDISEGNRWYYPVLRSDIYIDFLNPLRPRRENLLSRQKIHFLGLRLTNDYVYNVRDQRDHSSVTGVSFEAGGFDLWLLERLRFLEITFYWYRVYFDRSLDHMRYSAKADIQLSRTIFLEFEIESRATDVERYDRHSRDENGQSNYVPFETDVANGLGLNGNRKRKETVFNVGYMESALVFDLHEWELRLGYALEQRSLFAGVNTREVVTFYDNKLFFSLTLLRFDLAGPADRPSRYLINRSRVRPGDIGRASYGASGR
ncbi:MAG: hypothetical protein HS115_18685 [Spirochaetales bacterium]|nr:hypothetical protein [Spirochaetales bacterium]